MKELTIVFGRFNPPTRGHERLFTNAKKIAGNGVLRIYPTKTQDKDKNPLPFDRKLYYLNLLLPAYRQYYCNDDNVKTIIDALVVASDEGFEVVQIVVGSDRVDRFTELTRRYNGELYNISKLKVISAGDRNEELEQVEGVSASIARNAVRKSDYATFIKCLPEQVSEIYKRELFDELSSNLNETR